MKFRKDINGLRALAVIAVVLFHFNPSWVPGGFAGVDVFFVISGFLMTSIIFKGLDSGDFSILRFYFARANRIIPALAVMCLFLLIFGWFYLTPVDYKDLSKHTIGSIGFFSNLVYWKESGYFDAASHEKWLLHTWSLSVEWQFYIIYPVILVALKKTLSLETLKKAVLAATVIGFLGSVLMTYRWPDASYYMLQTRAWEMLLGGVAFLYPLSLSSKHKAITEYTGLVLILASYFLMSEHSLWPGYLALFPVLGAYLIIAAQRDSSAITHNVFMQKIGLWSYSIYLWHWPLVVAGIYFELPYWMWIGIPASVLLGFVSHVLIESKRRAIPAFSVRPLLTYQPLWFVAIVSILGSGIFITKGAEFHYDPSVLVASNEANNKNPRRDECLVRNNRDEFCQYGEGKVGAIVLGDSHAASIVRSVEKVLDGESLADWTMMGCRTIKGIYNTRNHGIPDHSCGNFIEGKLAKLPQYPNVPVVILNRYATLLQGPNEPELAHRKDKVEEFFEGEEIIDKRGEAYSTQALGKMFETICTISESNPVYLLEPIPELKRNVPKTMAKELLWGNTEFRVSISRSEYDERNQAVFQMLNTLQDQCDVQILQTSQYFCDDQSCYGDIDGRPAYFDDDHLSEYGSIALLSEFRKIVN